MLRECSTSGFHQLSIELLFLLWSHLGFVWFRFWGLLGNDWRGREIIGDHAERGGSSGKPKRTKSWDLWLIWLSSRNILCHFFPCWWQLYDEIFCRLSSWLNLIIDLLMTWMKSCKSCAAGSTIMPYDLRNLFGILARKWCQECAIWQIVSLQFTWGSSYVLEKWKWANICSKFTSQVFKQCEQVSIDRSCLWQILAPHSGRRWIGVHLILVPFKGPLQRLHLEFPIDLL